MTDDGTNAQAEKFKNLGNDQFKLGKFQKAIEFYSQAIGKYTELSVVTDPIIVCKFIWIMET